MTRRQDKYVHYSLQHAMEIDSLKLNVWLSKPAQVPVGGFLYLIYLNLIYQHVIDDGGDICTVYALSNKSQAIFYSFLIFGQSDNSNPTKNVRIHEYIDSTYDRD